MWRVLSFSFVPVVCRVLISVNFLVGGVVAIGQEPSTLPDAPSSIQSQSDRSSLAQNVPEREPSKNHIFWIIPNYRSDENSEEIKPLTPGAKLKVALDDSFDPSAFLVAGIFAGVAMAQKQYSGSILWKYREEVGTTTSPGYVLQSDERVLAGCAQQTV